MDEKVNIVRPRSNAEVAAVVAVAAVAAPLAFTCIRLQMRSRRARRDPPNKMGLKLCGTGGESEQRDILMDEKPNREIRVPLLACLLITFLCSALAGCGREPVYNGKPLHVWVSLLQDERPDFSPSPDAIEAEKVVRTIGPAAIPWYIQWTKHWPDSTVATPAAFKVLGIQASNAIPELAEILEHKPASLDEDTAWDYALESISYLGPGAIPYLFAAVTNGVMPRDEVIQHFGNLGTNGVSVIPALIAWTSDPNLDVRLAAIDSLGRIAMEPETVVPVLHFALKDPEPKIRSEAATALGFYGKAANVAQPDLIPMLNDPDDEVQSSAIEALGEIGDPEVVLPLLVKKLHDSNSIVRQGAALALGDLGGQKAFDALMQATDDSDGYVLRCVFYSLNRIDPEQLEKSGKKYP